MANVGEPKHVREVQRPVRENPQPTIQPAVEPAPAKTPEPVAPTKEPVPA